MGSHREHQTYKLFFSSQSVSPLLSMSLFDWNHWSRTQVHFFYIFPPLSLAFPDCLWPIFKAGSRDSFATKMSRKRQKSLPRTHLTQFLPAEIFAHLRLQSMQNWHGLDALYAVYLKKRLRESAICTTHHTCTMRLCVTHVALPPSYVTPLLRRRRTRSPFGANIFAKPTRAGSFLLWPDGTGLSGHFCTGTASPSLLHMFVQTMEKELCAN